MTTETLDLRNTNLLSQARRRLYRPFFPQFLPKRLRIIFKVDILFVVYFSTFYIIFQTMKIEVKGDMTQL